jgi:hypothetical protein
LVESGNVTKDLSLPKNPTDLLQLDDWQSRPSFMTAMGVVCSSIANDGKECALFLPKIAVPYLWGICASEFADIIWITRNPFALGIYVRPSLLTSYGLRVIGLRIERGDAGAQPRALVMLLFRI